MKLRYSSKMQDHHNCTLKSELETSLMPHTRHLASFSFTLTRVWCQSKASVFGELGMRLSNQLSIFQILTLTADQTTNKATAFSPSPTSGSIVSLLMWTDAVELPTPPYPCCTNIDPSGSCFESTFNSSHTVLMCFSVPINKANK